MSVITGDHVAVLDAFGRWLEKVAVTDIEPCGSAPVQHDFPVVYVRWPDGDPDPDGNGVGWPVDDVVPYDECPGPVLSHADYLALASYRGAATGDDA